VSDDTEFETFASAVEGPIGTAEGHGSPKPHTVDKRSRLFIPVFLSGWAIIAFGATRALGDARDSHPLSLVVHVIAFDIGHDAVIAPVVFIVGWLLGALLPEFARGPVRAAFAASAMFAVFSFPLIRAWGRRPTNSSTLPLNYAHSLLVVLAVIWVIATVVLITRRPRSAAATTSIEAKD
jgi:hypothetical protein